MNLNASLSKSREREPIKSESGTLAAVPKRPGVSGTGMDEKVVPRHRLLKRVGLAGVVVTTLAGLILLSLSFTGERRLRVAGDTLIVGTTSRGIFEDFIPIRGRVTPLNTIYLDAIEGGRVENVYVEDGALLRQGDLIVSLSNTTLQLSVINSEAQVAEQLNAMRTLELALQQNNLRNQRELLDIDYRILTLSQQSRREQRLLPQGAVTQREVEATKDELHYQQQLRALTSKSGDADRQLQQQQLEALRISSARLEKSLEVTRQKLEDLNVRAPQAGKLSGFTVEIGQSVERGGSLGQIDDPQHFKVRAFIDEFYLNRVDIGQTALVVEQGNNFRLTIQKIYPQINNGQFQVDLLFTDAEPPGLRRGQTLQAKLTLGDETQALLIPNGSFMQDTGGNWVFVLTADGTEAVKRSVRLGRSNSQFVEVLDGLQAGEEVVTSSYAGYLKMDRLKINQ